MRQKLCDCVSVVAVTELQWWRALKICDHNWSRGKIATSKASIKSFSHLTVLDQTKYIFMQILTPTFVKHEHHWKPSHWGFCVTDLHLHRLTAHDSCVCWMTAFTPNHTFYIFIYLPACCSNTHFDCCSPVTVPEVLSPFNPSDAWLGGSWLKLQDRQCC